MSRHYGCWIGEPEEMDAYRATIGNVEVGIFRKPEDVKHGWYRDLSMEFTPIKVPNDGRRFAYDKY